MGDFLYICWMKDLSGYIMSLVEDLNYPIEIERMEDGKYCIYIVWDLNYDISEFTISGMGFKYETNDVRLRLMKYLESKEYVIKTKYINFPKYT
jgi:hypothetical protein